MTAGRIIFVALLLVAMAAAAGVYADVSSLAEEFTGFDWWMVAPALALAFANYAIRFVKWHYFLRVVKQRARVGDSALVFFSGLSMSVTPGKVGELLKSYLLSKTSGVPASASVPVVVAERLTDLISLILLAMFGVATLGYGWDIVGAAVFLCLAVVVVAVWKPAGTILLSLAGRLPGLRGKRDDLRGLQTTMYTLVGPKSMLFGTVLSVAAWFAECAAFALVLKAAGVPLSLANATFIYALGTIAGAVTMLPGGLVATEASMVFMLVEFFAACGRAAAVTSVLIVRLCTLWFAVLVGLVALWLVRTRLGGQLTGAPLGPSSSSSSSSQSSQSSSSSGNSSSSKSSRSSG